MKKQTAVEWLINELYIEMNLSGDGRVLDEILKEAKEMEKEQIIEAYNESFRLRDNPYAIAEKYYKQTYGGKK